MPDAVITERLQTALNMLRKDATLVHIRKDELDNDPSLHWSNIQTAFNNNQSVVISEVKIGAALVAISDKLIEIGYNTEYHMKPLIRKVQLIGH